MTTPSTRHSHPENTETGKDRKGNRDALHSYMSISFPFDGSASLVICAFMISTRLRWFASTKELPIEGRKD